VIRHSLERMRVMLVAHGFPPEEQSGTELYTAELAQELARSGHDVAVFTGGHSAHAPVQAWRREGAVEIERVARPRPRLRLNFSNASVENDVLAAVNRFGPDVVHVQHLLGLTMPFVPLLKERGIPVVLTLHDHWFLCPEVQPFRPGLHRIGGDRWGLNCFLHLELGRPRRAASMLAPGELTARVRTHLERARRARAELAAADILIAPSRFLRARFVAFGLPDTKLFVLPHGLPPLAGAGAPAARTPEVRVGYLGPLLHAKGVDLLLRAFRGVRNPALRLEIRGPAPDARFAERVRRLAARDDRIAVGPAIPHDEIGAFFAGIDLLVVPSRFQESFSLVVHEAFAARVPVVASNTGALPEVIAEGANGALFHAGSRRDLRRRLRGLLEDPSALDTLTSFPPEKTMAAHAGELVALYGALTAGEELPQPLAR
jgi:glycosyltransferase involved in cell wall biosynthesis